jgi:hypothetical protein
MSGIITKSHADVMRKIQTFVRPAENQSRSTAEICTENVIFTSREREGVQRMWKGLEAFVEWPQMEAKVKKWAAALYLQQQTSLDAVWQTPNVQGASNSEFDAGKIVKVSRNSSCGTMTSKT